jgi:membrane carboxypeptidase/penicillin-binding protein PbpC
MDQVAGTDGAATIWHDIMEAAHAGQPNEPFPRPAGVVETWICAHDGSVASGCADAMPERFVVDALSSAPSTSTSASLPLASASATSLASMTVRLVQPAPDTRIATGTLLPLAAEGSAGTRRIEFLVDGHVVGGTDQITATWNWTATTRGRHTLEAASYDTKGNRVVSAPLVVVVE